MDTWTPEMEAQLNRWEDHTTGACLAKCEDCLAWFCTCVVGAAAKVCHDCVEVALLERMYRNI